MKGTGLLQSGANKLNRVKKKSAMFLKNEIKTFLLQQMIKHRGNEPTGAAERQEKFQSHQLHCLTRPGDLLTST